MNDSDTVEFNLGYDLCRYRRFIPDKARTVLIQGWRLAEEKHLKNTKKADEYVKKWLQIRVGAFKRNKYFDQTINSDYLRRIDLDQCPVTNVPLTKSDGSDNDWSIDRVINTHGYVASNLLVMSTLANKAKSDRCLIQVREIAEDKKLFGHPDSTYEGLTRTQWQTLSKLMYPAFWLAVCDEPTQYLSGEHAVLGQPYGHPAIFQAMMSDVLRIADREQSHRGRCALARLFKHLESRAVNKRRRRCLKKMALDYFNRLPANNPWSYWQCPKPDKLFRAMWQSLDESTRQYIAARYLSPRLCHNGFRHTPSGL